MRRKRRFKEKENDIYKKEWNEVNDDRMARRKKTTRKKKSDHYRLDDMQDILRSITCIAKQKSLIVIKSNL